jgi:predicted dithiol-disulfide oxidoreductase (DUF899 family)
MFPNESDSYRSARNDLLTAEIDLRRQLEAVAAKRRTLPLGGEIPQDYEFDAAAGPVRMSELFTGGKETLIVYSFMFGPQMESACPSCTSILDGLDGESPHVNQRADFVVVARSPIERIMGHAEARGWRNLRLLSSSRNSYNPDYRAELEDGSQMPILNVFARRDGKIRHFYGTELLYAKSEPGQDPRHVDLIWPMWQLFDLTPEGRGEKWGPRLSY